MGKEITFGKYSFTMLRDRLGPDNDLHFDVKRSDYLGIFETLREDSDTIVQSGEPGKYYFSGGGSASFKDVPKFIGTRGGGDGSRNRVEVYECGGREDPVRLTIESHSPEALNSSMRILSELLE